MRKTDTNLPDARLEAALREPEPALEDDGFSDRVMGALPPKRFAGAKARRWTLALAAVSGGVLTLLLGAPLEKAFSSLALGSYATSIIALLFVTLIALPTVWAFHPE
jgi:hypothetical protein